MQYELLTTCIQQKDIYIMTIISDNEQSLTLAERNDKKGKKKH